jgi:hypothetical protein
MPESKIMPTSDIIIKKYSIPFVSIILFIIVLILDIVQYTKKDKKYLQNKILKNMRGKNPVPNIQNTLLIFYQMVGINSLIVQSLWYIIYVFVSWGLMSLIEMHVGHISLIYFFLMIFGMTYLINTINTYTCLNGLNDTVLELSFGSCCGSQIMWSALGFVLMLYLLNVKNAHIKIALVIVAIGIYIGLVCYDKYYAFKGMENTTCNGLTWHCLYFLFGLFSGFVIGKK